MMEVERLIGTKEAAEILGFGRRHVERLSRAGKLPAVQLGHVWRFRPSALMKFIAEGEETNLRKTA